MGTRTKLLRLPDRGRLLVATDLHGNLRDFLALVAHFETLGSDGHLLFLGDLIHGPQIPLERWPDYPNLRGRPYSDQSPAILLGVSEMMSRHPGRVFALLGNHEHAHIGGPRTSRFVRDEAAALEQRLGIENSSWLSEFIASLPLWAMAPCGLLFSHAAPAAVLNEPTELERIDYRRYDCPRSDSLDAYRSSDKTDLDAAALLGQLLWKKSLPPPLARQVLDPLGLTLCIYGHSVIPAGYQAIGAQQLIVSSSFGMEDAYKKILCLDLAAKYPSVTALRLGHEIVPLYPLPSASSSHDRRDTAPQQPGIRPTRSTMPRIRA